MSAEQAERVIRLLKSIDDRLSMVVSAVMWGAGAFLVFAAPIQQIANSLQTGFS